MDDLTVLPANAWLTLVTKFGLVQLKLFGNIQNQAETVQSLKLEAQSVW
jgi:hypothetical protein